MTDMLILLPAFCLQPNPSEAVKLREWLPRFQPLTAIWYNRESLFPGCLVCENTIPSPSVTKHNPVFFDVNFQEEHFSVYSYKAHFLPMQGQLQPLAFRLSLTNIPGTCPMALRRQEPRDQIFAVWGDISECSHQQRQTEGQVSGELASGLWPTL